MKVNRSILSYKMITIQWTPTPRFRGQDKLLYWSAHVKTMLKAKRVWHVVRGINAASSSSSHRDRMNTRNGGAGASVDSEHAKNVLD